MSQTPPSTPFPGSGPDTKPTVELGDENRIDEVLNALEDGECRAILAATTTEALSASEIAETCDIALSTTYRKLDRLVDAELLEEKVRISKSGKHTSEYRLRFENITLSVTPETGFELSLAGVDETEQDHWALAGAD